MIEEMLKIQDLDRELLNLIKQANSLEEKAVMNKMISFVKDAQNRTLTYDENAKDLINEYNDLKKCNVDLNGKINKILKQDVSKMDYATANKTVDEINSLSSELFMCERKLNIIITKSKEILKEFEITKNNAVKARAKHKESKEAFEGKMAKIEEQMKKIKQSIKRIETKVDKDLLNNYNAIKNDKFPVFVTLDGKSCAACRVELPASKLDKFKNQGYLKCENCGRVLYQKLK